MDGLTFFKISQILSKDLCGGNINNFGVKDDFIFISIYKDGKIKGLEYRASPQPPALLICDESVSNSPGALSNIVGTRIISIGTYGYERISYFNIEKRKPSGKLLQFKMIFEPLGNYANFFLLNDKDVILYSLSSRTIDPDRNIGVGSAYQLPKANKIYSLDNYTGAESFNDLVGFYNVTARHADLYFDRCESKAEAFMKVKSLIMADDNFYIDDKGKVIPFLIDNPVEVITIDDLRRFYTPKGNSISDVTRDKNEILSIYKKPLNKYIKIQDKLKKELIEAESSSKYSTEAELLRNNLHKINGEGDYILEDYSTGEIKEVPYKIGYGELVKVKIDKLFKRASRLKRSVPIIEARIEEFNQLIFSAEEQIYFIESIDDVHEIKKLKTEIKADEKVKKNKADLDIKEFHTYKGDGFSIYVGRNSRSNHRLITNFAIDSDIWFHARLIPSAHLILRIEREGVLNDELILYVASIVSAFSKNKGELKVDVDYTRRKYLTKPKKTPIGFVTYKNFNSVTVTPMSRIEIEKIFKI